MVGAFCQASGHLAGRSTCAATTTSHPSANPRSMQNSTATMLICFLLIYLSFSLLCYGWPRWALRCHAVAERNIGWLCNSFALQCVAQLYFAYCCVLFCTAHPCCRYALRLMALPIYCCARHYHATRYYCWSCPRSAPVGNAVALLCGTVHDSALLLPRIATRGQTVAVLFVASHRPIPLHIAVPPPRCCCAYLCKAGHHAIAPRGRAQYCPAVPLLCFFHRVLETAPTC